jgi:shikimate kinase
VIERNAPLFLVGFMGVGKTTVGRALARLLGWDCLDLDERIVAIAGRSIPRIFEEDGEAYYRRLETEVLLSLRGRNRIVVSCGGGTYANVTSREVIDALGGAVWLQAPLAQALARCGRGPDRPMLKDSIQAEALYRARLPAYRLAPLRVEVEALSPEEVAERIAALL